MSGCSQLGCDRPHGAKGLCNMHYARWRRGLLGVELSQPRGLSIADRLARYTQAGSPDECWEWTGRPTQHGYGHLKCKVDGHFRYVLAHRLALEQKLGRPLTGWALHTCDNRLCVNPAHLYEGDRMLNAQDAVVRGRYHVGVVMGKKPALGVDAPNAKLTEAQVREIRRRYAAGGVSQQALGSEFGVNQTKISDVVRRKTWRHVR